MQENLSSCQKSSGTFAQVGSNALGSSLMSLSLEATARGATKNLFCHQSTSEVTYPPVKSAALRNDFPNFPGYVGMICICIPSIPGRYPPPSYPTPKGDGLNPNQNMKIRCLDGRKFPQKSLISCHTKSALPENPEVRLRGDFV